MMKFVILRLFDSLKYIKNRSELYKVRGDAERIMGVEPSRFARRNCFAIAILCPFCSACGEPQKTDEGGSDVMCFNK